ncbi:MAG: alpha-L-fucosidase [Bacteroidaceae bacterium]|nr:alpha-L-fucosidase [Bacteroidaceae bacterium]
MTLVSALLSLSCLAQQQVHYVPTTENLKARQEFADSKLGIFIHWGIYSMFAQGEWYMTNANIDNKEYAKAASAFYPIGFDAKEWVSAIKAAGAKYICFTSRHHDGFSMWDTEQSDYNIVDATPFGRDVIKELADECHRQGIKLHFYYSHIDWTRDDYPAGRTGRGTGKDPSKEDWPAYYAFMNRQLTELLTRYGDVGAIWFDGWWDHDIDSIPFDWQLEEQYALIHRLQPACLVGNNHHQTPIEGEDIQIFERDLPGENKAGLSGQAVSRLPLETCQTMNGMWGYKIIDQNYKSTETLIRYLVSTSGKGANLLLNVGPQPNGQLPAAALDRLREIGKWTSRYGETIYGTVAGDIPVQEWGVTTRKGNRLFVHIFDHQEKSLTLPLQSKVKKAFVYDTKQTLKTKRTEEGVTIFFDEEPSGTDYIVELEMRD